MREKLNDIAMILVNLVAIAMLTVLLVLLYKAIFSEPEKSEIELPQLPNIDRDAALEYLEKGECLGGEIEEQHFTFFICRED